ncbi:ylmG homolog protein 1-2, chloroplastic-like [Mangifera indica]|uniref:ylmG homolog protein 1-2, chloroplastic-like n=1 Tax=Mangifera indica TaxID=29780 RepID=UPI001CFB38A8|nr:ylmG homolog protein 1-2, chloroplastic-like [Mangifera indica]
MATSLLFHRAPLFLSNPIPNPNHHSHRYIPLSLHIKNKPLKVFLRTPQIPTQSPFLVDSTRTITTILSLTLSLSGLFAKSIQNFAVSLIPNPQNLLSLQSVQNNMVHTVGPLFFAATRDRPIGLNTPLTVVAAGLAKWLDIYSGVLMVRVLLSWFPNIPWDRQPLSAIRDLCDPYLNLFRNIIPPIFDTLDVSPLLAFAVLGTLGAILNGSSGIY